jgi:UDPglucose--hexose-1-phosphate uridylyltransferase
MLPPELADIVEQSEFRQDVVSGRWVILAPERAKRPLGLSHVKPQGRVNVERDVCPFCPGREHDTPPETYAVRPGGGAPDTPGWVVRVVPNKFPVLTPSEDAASGAPERGSGTPELFESAPARGFHEVIVHGPRHATSITELEPAQFRAAVAAWGARLAAHPEARYVHLIVNEGLIAGASLEHTHAQLYALSFVPALVARERERATAHNTRTMGGCLLCDLLQEEVRRRERVVAVDDQAVLLAPYASRMPYELQVVPREHQREAFEVGIVADILREGLARLARVLGTSPPFNLWVRTAPRGAEHFHWHVDVLPRLTQLAGLEIGAGVGVNVFPPERAAEELRNA